MQSTRRGNVVPNFRSRFSPLGKPTLQVVSIGTAKADRRHQRPANSKEDRRRCLLPEGDAPLCSLERLEG